MGNAFSVHANRWALWTLDDVNYNDTIKGPLQTANLSFVLLLTCWGSEIQPYTHLRSGCRGIWFHSAGGDVQHLEP